MRYTLFAILLISCSIEAQTFSVREQSDAASAPSNAIVYKINDSRFLVLVPCNGCSGPRWTYREDLSYRPQHDNGIGTFARIDFFYGKPGTLAKAEELAKLHARIDADAGIAHGREIYVGDDDLIVQIVHAASRSAYEAERARSEKMRGDRIRSVYAAEGQILDHMTSVDAMQVRPRIYSTDAVLLPGAKGLVTLDYIAFDHNKNSLWVPAGNTGSVDVIKGKNVRRIGGFATREFSLNGRRGFLGASSVTIGDGEVYVGDRADASICAIDAATLRKRKCVRIAGAADGWAAAPDAVVYVPTADELWITRGAPPLGIPSADRAITILDARTLEPKDKLPLPGSAEGYAVDAARNLFFTNIEESGETVAIDVRERRVVAKWKSGCDEPHGLAVDASRNLIFVACNDRVIALRDGNVTATLPAGAGVDNIDFFGGSIFAAAADAATVTIAAVRDDGSFADVTSIPAAKSTRVVVAGNDGVAFVADPLGGRILKLTPNR